MRKKHLVFLSQPTAIRVLGWMVLLALGGLLSTSVGQAQDFAGQEDLDQATLTKLSAASLADLETVSELCESALAKGLDENNQIYARDLLKSTLYEQAERLSRLIFDQQPVDPRWPQIRQICLEKLQRALDVDAEMGNVHLLVSRLQALPGGDRDQANASIAKAMPTLADEPDMLSLAYQTRAALADTPEKALEDLDKAIEVSPRNTDAWRARGVHYLSVGNFDKALADLEELLSRAPDDQMAHQAIAQTLRQLKQFDKAVEHLDQVLATNPDSALAYNLKARIAEEQGDLVAALENLNEAIRVQSQDVGALLYRARLLTSQQQFDLANNDIEAALKLRPELPQAILLRSVIAAAQGRFSEAIEDLEQLSRLDPDNVEIRLQMGAFYEADRRPGKAVEIYDEILSKDADNWLALRRRGDAYLSLAEQGKAIEDYEAALVLNAADPGLLNNFAWVLATSPQDKLRDGARAVEIATKACELTNYSAAHILSTLAASYAEVGDFESAIKYSEKAVELDAEEDQLAKELASYQQRKAWREAQNVEAKEEPPTTAAPVNSQDVFDDLPDLDLKLDTDVPQPDGAVTPDPGRAVD